MPLRHSAANTSASVADIVFILHPTPLIHSHHCAGQAVETFRSVSYAHWRRLGTPGRLMGAGLGNPVTCTPSIRTAVLDARYARLSDKIGYNHTTGKDLPWIGHTTGKDPNTWTRTPSRQQLKTASSCWPASMCPCRASKAKVNPCSRRTLSASPAPKPPSRSAAAMPRFVPLCQSFPYSLL